jgi:NitT/TauT family transport system substrate-binding protein
MNIQHAQQLSRRRFLGGLTLAGTVGLLGLSSKPVAAEPPPETTTLKIIQGRSICTAPQYVAEALLRGEGFTEVQYVETGKGTFSQLLASGDAHLVMTVGASLIPVVDAGGRRQPIVRNGPWLPGYAWVPIR